MRPQERLRAASPLETRHCLQQRGRLGNQLQLCPGRSQERDRDRTSVFDLSRDRPGVTGGDAQIVIEVIPMDLKRCGLAEHETPERAPAEEMYERTIAGFNALDERAAVDIDSRRVGRPQ